MTTSPDADARRAGHRPAAAPVGSDARVAVARSPRRARGWSSAPGAGRCRCASAPRPCVVTGVIVLLIGLFLVDQISGGVLKAKRDAAVDQAKVGLQRRPERPRRGRRPVYADGSAAAQQITVDPHRRTAPAPACSPSSSGRRGQRRPSRRRTASSRRPARDGRRTATWPCSTRRCRVAATRASDGRRAHRRRAGPPQAGLFELYYLFPLTAEQQTIDLVQRTVLLAGLALVHARARDRRCW